MKYLIQNKNWDIVEDYNLEKLLYLLIDRPTCINEWNDFVWTYNDKNQRHRDYNLPAYIWENVEIYGTFWCKNDKLHRENDKPAIVWCNGRKEYWIGGECIRTNDELFNKK